MRNIFFWILLAIIYGNMISINTGISNTKIEMEKQTGIQNEIKHPEIFLDAVTVDDPFRSSQWSLDYLNIEQLWQNNTGSRNILVAVVDTGINYTHPDLKDQYLPLGRDWYNDDSDPMDDQGHGTNVAGIIAASINNSLGISGTANVSIFAEKVFPGSGTSDTSYAISAINHAVQVGANIISCSWGGSEYDEDLHSAIKTAVNKGVIVVAAAGNDNNNKAHYPASFEETIGVGSLDTSYQKAAHSNYGNMVDIMAPGVNIYSTNIDGRYKFDNTGTSFATPQISGILALLWSIHKDYSARDIEDLLLSKTSKIDENAMSYQMGHGKVNLGGTLDGLYPYDVGIVMYTLPLSSILYYDNKLDISVRNYGLNTIQDVNLTIYSNGSIYHTQLLDLKRGESIDIDTIWHPFDFSPINLSIVLEHPMDQNPSNNKYIKILNAEIDENYYFQEKELSWFDAKSNGFPLGLTGDNVHTSYILPFPFLYYDNNFTTLSIFDDGYISFSSLSYLDSAYIGKPFPDMHFPYTIAVMYNNLIAENNIYIWEQQDKIIIEYDQYKYVNDVFVGSFEVVLYQNGTIILQYKNVDITKYTSLVGLNQGNDISLYTNIQGNIANRAFVLNQKGIYHGLELEYQSDTWDGVNYPDIAMQLYNHGHYQETGSISIQLNGKNVLKDSFSLAIGEYWDYTLHLGELLENTEQELIIQWNSAYQSEKESVMYFVDTQSPEITTEDDISIQESSYTLDITITDNVEVELVTIYLEDTLLYSKEIGLQTYSFEMLIKNLKVGENTVKIDARDTSGNVFSKIVKIQVSSTSTKSFFFPFTLLVIPIYTIIRRRQY